MADHQDHNENSYNPDTNAAATSNQYALNQRKVQVQRELERMAHVITRLGLQETRSSKRAQIAELKARDVEAVRHESERDARIREQLMVEERDRQSKQQQRVAAMRQDRKQRSESARGQLATAKVEAARVAKEQHKFINYTLSESNAEHHDRCVVKHDAIKASQQQGSTARARTVDRKRAVISSGASKAKDELAQQEQQLQALVQRAEALRRRVDQSRSVETAANGRLQDLCNNGNNNNSHSGTNSPNQNNNTNNNNGNSNTNNNNNNNNSTRQGSSCSNNNNHNNSITTDNFNNTGGSSNVIRNDNHQQENNNTNSANTQSQSVGTTDAPPSTKTNNSNKNNHDEGDQVKK